MSFKTKSIVVRTQSVADHDLDAADSAKQSNIDLKNILAMTAHFNTSNRKDALNRLKDLITDDPRTMVLHLSQIINGVAPILLDREYEVRKALIQFAKVLVKLAPAKLLMPFVTVVITYACSAMNHIVNEIRYDAVRFINIWIETFPASFVGPSDQIIQNYMSLLSLKRQKVTGQDSFIKKSKEAAMDSDQIVVLSSMSKLLDISGDLTLGETKQPSAYSLYFKSREMELGRLRRPSFLLNKPVQSLPSINSNDRIQLTLGETVVAAKAAPTIKWGPSDFVNAIVPACIDIWLEAVPLVLSGVMINENQSLEKLNLAMAIIHQALVKHVAVCTDVERKAIVSAFSKHILVSFPYGNNAVGIKTEYCEQVLQEMNIKTCEIVSLFQKSDWSGGQNENNSWEEKMFDYIFKIIAAKLMELLVRRHKELSPKTALWSEMFAFIEKGFMEINPTVNNTSKVEWISYLPKALWGLGNSNERASKSILAFLSTVLRTLPQTEESLGFAETRKQYSERHYSVLLRRHASEGPIYGPFLLLSVETQKAAIEMLYYLPTWSEKLVSALASCLTSSSHAPLKSLLSDKVSPNVVLEWDIFFGFVFTVGVVGSTSDLLGRLQSSELATYESYGTTFGQVAKGELEQKCGALSGLEVALVRRRVYLSRMVAQLLRSHFNNGALEFTLDVLAAFQVNIKTLDSFFGVSSLLSAILEEAGPVELNNEFLSHLSGLCSTAILMCLATSHENYDLFKMSADVSLEVLTYLPGIVGQFRETFSANSKNLSYSLKDRVKMILDRLQ
ncbi:hypothetical protein BCR33DRAFT_783469 [Rhizoclosmatium globosum]|uniref:Pre-rRNA-processing protein n=1 Tax=Rhizoclosmatium globosum TaxID=329046 RepID=A0A1Y2CJ47_9FUNG|nr:hypothetical protein BCR33DRAFT_783469 [Rhizoclosmatium globosum]|eukprot:ORY47052.1 hypothetical protein BCR33DRAFT_783469 [Rhizoclosmatium globosum]